MFKVYSLGKETNCYCSHDIFISFFAVDTVQYVCFKPNLTFNKHSNVDYVPHPKVMVALISTCR